MDLNDADSDADADADSRADPFAITDCDTSGKGLCWITV